MATIILGTFGLLAFFMVRMIPLFGFVCLGLLPGLIFYAFGGVVGGKKWGIRGICSAVLVLCLLWRVQGGVMDYNPMADGFGKGVPDYVQRSAQFFKQSGLKGPVFNNYDIGGYLIYHLFPIEKVFVDNRPEAYPDTFFEDIFFPMQEKESVWSALDREYDFNVIYFFRHDRTTHAQQFLYQRVQDPDWVPVFVDDYTLILVKNRLENRVIIERFQLPRSMFSVVSKV